MKFKVKVKMNSVNKIIKDHGLDKDGKITQFIRNDADRLMDSFIPRRCKRTISKIKNISK